MFKDMVTLFDKALGSMWLVQQADGPSRKSGANRSCPRRSSSCPKQNGERAATARRRRRRWNTRAGNSKVVMRSVVGTHMFAVPWMKVSAEYVSLKIHKSVSDKNNCTDEVTSQQLAAFAAELKNMGKDLFETTKPWKVTFTCRVHSFPSFCRCH